MRVAPSFLSASLAVVSLAALPRTADAASPGSSWTFTKACFIPPANPPPQRSSVATADNVNNSNTALSAKKKTAAPAASKKIQVKLLKHVAGTGQAGDVVLVTPPFFNNKLRPTKSATLISDEQVKMEKDEAALAEKERQTKAAAIKEQVEGSALVVTRKAGPDGQLFGGIGAKIIMEELKASTGESDFLDSKPVKITQLMDDNGKKMRGDIKHTGSFTANLSLMKDVVAKVAIEVKAEE